MKRPDRRLRRKGVPLLVFLLLLMNYRFSLKIAALAFIYIMRPRISYRPDGIGWFYVAMPVMAVLSYFLVSHQYGSSYIPVALISILIWAGCFFAYLQLRHAVAIQPGFKVTNALKVLAVINFSASVVDFLKVALVTRTINPFTQVSPPPYGISSGDLIGGAFGLKFFLGFATESLQPMITIITAVSGWKPRKVISR